MRLPVLSGKCFPNYGYYETSLFLLGKLTSFHLGHGFNSFFFCITRGYLTHKVYDLERSTFDPRNLSRTTWMKLWPSSTSGWLLYIICKIHSRMTYRDYTKVDYIVSVFCVCDHLLQAEKVMEWWIFQQTMRAMITKRADPVSTRWPTKSVSWFVNLTVVIALP